MRTFTWALAALILTTGRSVHAGNLQVVSVSPALSSGNAPLNAPIVVNFDQPVLRSSVNSASFWAFARWSGAVEGAIAFSNGDQTITLTPFGTYSAGEQVMVILSHDIRAIDGSPLRAAGYSWQFMTRARPAALNFASAGTLNARSKPGVGVRSYGGIASDLNNDGWLDLTIVNEDSFDLRVFMNTANGTGSFGNFLVPTFPVGHRASPSEPADFNRDGFTDICVANINSNTVSILLGNGDGTYGPQQSIVVGSAPRGIAVLDADGDGDVDIVNTNTFSSNLSIMLNNGSGVFGAPAFFEGGGSGEWPLAAAEMNEDGILDLVAGARNSQTVLICRSNGNATFTNIGAHPAGGMPWMVNAADLNGDGHNDVATANSNNNTGSILLGNGAGGLSAPVTVATDPFPLGSDLGDLDGDGDLDWAISSFGGDWRFYLNNGSGAFAFWQEIDSPQAASCALFLDNDNDGDLDLGLIDELADVIILMRNSGIAAPGDINGDGAVDVNDLLLLIGTWGPCPLPCAADLNMDGAVDVNDLLILIGAWG